MLTKIRSAVQRFKSWIVEYHNDTLLGLALRDTTPEEWNKLKQTAFENAKKVSDFAAIIMRAAFIYLCFLFFFRAADNAEFWLRKIMLSAMGGLSLALYFYIFIKLLRVVSIYFTSDTALSKSKTLKILFLLSSLWITFAFAFGLGDLVLAFANSSNLLK